MRLLCRSVTLGVALAAALLVTEFSAQRPPLADEAINKDRASRAVLFAKGKWSAAHVQHKPGFFGTIFQLVKDQINDTKSAYSQISELVNNQFTDDVTPASPGGAGAEGGNATEAPTKISRAEFLRILDRNLKGLRRLRELEWREAKKDSMANIRAYKEEAFRGKNPKAR